ncbi:hypothetical protein GALMADRAFT_788675 [Galerina marginata CBS 339.88]|uniref:CFEM domain-containing protein n=1 Tax=Galerina marginata (strain CBS 339.88) TaxID=685588 RepID=A0A067SXP4_GALM3|nr:hypothetical protein GALMADRAFT_788675 [Galerina marginata CBS 339.88]
MHFKPLVLTTIFTILAVAKAQIIAPVAWWASLDPCALQCAQKAADKAGCNINDIKCLCNSTSFWTDFKNCVQLSCPLVSDVSSSPIAVFNKACSAFLFHRCCL